MTEETVSTAYERLVQRRRTFGSKVENETVYNNKENAEELPSMVLEEQPVTSLWDDDGSVQGLASDDDEEEEAEADCHDNQTEADNPVIDAEPNTEETTDDAEKDYLSATKASDEDSNDPTNELFEDGAESDHNNGEKDSNDEDEISALPSYQRSEDKSQSPTTNTAVKSNAKGQEDDDDSGEDEAPSLETILKATDKLFDEVEDKGSVTVKQILERLGVSLDKAIKKAVRQRLVELITSWQHQQEKEKSDESSKGDSSDEEGHDDEEEACDEEEEEIGDADDEYEPDARKPRASKAKRTRVVAIKRTRGLVSEKTRRKKLNKGLQKSALRIQAEHLRKKRMQELRVRNEELQYESKDQERAEQIAAKFETQTDDQLRERLSNRVNLWQKLDQKRWNVLQAQPIIKSKPLETVESNTSEADPIDDTTNNVPVEDDHSSDSDSDDDLEITGPTKTLMLTRNSPKKVKRDVLSLLELSSPKLAGHRKEPTISPNRSLANLKRQLKSKHQKMGNLWLAQELGYKNEQEHIQDCVQLEERKRQLQLAREQERLKESELRQERLLQLGVNCEEDEGQQTPPDEDQSREDYDDEKPTDEDGEDEEIAMAREMGVLASNSNLVDETSHLGEDEVESASTRVASSVAGGHDAVPAPPADNSFVSTSKNQVDHEDGGRFTLKVNPVESKEDLKLQSNNDSAEVTLAESTSNDDNEGGAHSDPNEDNEETQIGDQRTEAEPEKPKGPRNAAWKAMLKREEEKLKRLKRRGKGSLVEEEAEEEEEEEVAGLEDFGFKIHKKKNDDEEDEDNLPDDDEDMDDVVDELSDNEGDEDAGEKARREQQKKEEKERHKEILRRMRDGYDGRRGGIAGGSARGIHRFDQLVAADNREDAKRLGLLNDDELDSEDDAAKKDSDDEEEDENALLDKMLKDRFLHRSSVEVEEDFSGDEDDDDKASGDGEYDDKQTEEEREQERLAKRFSKRARMQRLIDAHGHDEEFSRSKLIDDDEMIKTDLQRMKNGLARKRSVSSTASKSASDTGGSKRQKKGIFGEVFHAGGSLAIALQANRRSKSRTSFVRTGAATSSETRIHQQSTSISFNHVVFRATTENSQSRSNFAVTDKPGSSRRVTPPQPNKSGSSLWSKSVLAGFQKKHK
ncbi:hypothetical protein FisN_10Lh026 [Fistulifera solaris]|uniref:DNA replication checkpoint mediator MRC1 domain-containing protein n=1 Tax=Fistulifera solaris TaxID=1519565 RepID=A0A1Z5JTB3_FISSO|nr:hypothetical protein FisN_10Lh026 [Fistulifera solaris]|eukprot:GAX17179.1 hypothetical protein FisN_10Lh026 [Fistulifera solaris]